MSESPGTAAPGSNAHIVIIARNIYNPNPRHNGTEYLLRQI